MPGALGYTVWLVQPDGTLGARLFGRECWGPVVAAAIGLHKDGLEPKGERGRFGFPTPRTPPMSTQEREKQVRVQRSALEAAGATLAQATARARIRPGRSDGGGGGRGAVRRSPHDARGRVRAVDCDGPCGRDRRCQPRAQAGARRLRAGARGRHDARGTASGGRRQGRSRSGCSGLPRRQGQDILYSATE